MTWSARITDREGNPKDSFANICGDCCHVEYCHLHKVESNVGYMLTSIDRGCDGHMASGKAELRCDGFEPNTQTSGEGTDSAGAVETGGEAAGEG